MSTITEFTRSLFTEYRRPNLFTIRFYPPFIANKLQDSSVAVRSGQIPGLTINTLQNIYNNKTQNYGNTIDLDPITIEFLIPENDLSYSMLLEWSRSVILPNRQMNYKEQYAGRIEIELLNKLTVSLDSGSITANLINAFPINVSPLELSHDTTDDLLRFSCSFVYDDVEFQTNTYSDSLI